VTTLSVCLSSTSMINLLSTEGNKVNYDTLGGAFRLDHGGVTLIGRVAMHMYIHG